MTHAFIVRRPLPITFTVAALFALAGCGGNNDGPTLNVQPSYVRNLNTLSYDGVSDDLLTAGLGKTGIIGSAPVYANPASPTAAELRRAAIQANYPALLDTTANGGYGTLYGPNVTAAGVVTTGEGKIAGTETLAFSDDGSGRRNVTLMVQLPASFDPANPCIQTATSSGSRGVYGGLSTGEWGLKKGCAVAYDDKGTGAAPHDLQNDTVPLIDGTRTGSAAAAASAAFRAQLTAVELAAFNAATPNRFAFKHAHSQQNSEKDWGLGTLQAIELAFFVINQRHGAVDAASGLRIATFHARNTIVIASSVSNGGGAALAALERDQSGLISGLAVAEPQVNLPASPGVSVRRGTTTPATIAKTVYDYTSYANVFQPCAALSSQLAGTPFQAAYAGGFGFFAGNRCASLAAKGLLTATTTATRADEALAKLRSYGWEAEADGGHATAAAFEVASAVSVTFGNSLSRSSVKDNLCGYSYAAVTGAGAVTTLPATSLASMFASGNGVPPSGGVQLVNNLNPAGPLRDLLSTSPSTALADMNTDGALCLRGLVAGTGPAALALQAGVNETRRNGNLRGKPAIIVHGRSDALLPVNNTSRPYYALNKVAEGSASKLSYIEVTNAQHFDAFIGFGAFGLGGFDTRYIPLHVYLNRALDAVYANLKSGTALPGSQVLRTVPRGGTAGSAPAITAANVPPIATVPAAADAIAFSGTTVTVPD